MYSVDGSDDFVMKMNAASLQSQQASVGGSLQATICCINPFIYPLVDMK